MNTLLRDHEPEGTASSELSGTKRTLLYAVVFTVITVILGIWIFSMAFNQPKSTYDKLEIPLPKDAGMGEISVVDPILEEISIYMNWDAVTGKTKLRVGDKIVADFNELEAIIREDVVF